MEGEEGRGRVKLYKCVLILVSTTPDKWKVIGCTLVGQAVGRPSAPRMEEKEKRNERTSSFLGKEPTYFKIHLPSVPSFRHKCSEYTESCISWEDPRGEGLKLLVT